MTELRQRMQEELRLATTAHRPSVPILGRSPTSPATSISRPTSWAPNRYAGISFIC